MGAQIRSGQQRILFYICLMIMNTQCTVEKEKLPSVALFKSITSKSVIKALLPTSWVQVISATSLSLPSSKYANSPGEIVLQILKRNELMSPPNIMGWIPVELDAFYSAKKT